ncbi:MAG: hypothetical protein WC197_09930 [Candidatus Gastranaerophilaceae bacterium]|jgi:hypothetical protein
MTNNLLNVKDCWLTADIVAELKGITERAVRLSIRSKKYISKTYNTRGGKSYKVLLSSLEPKIQQKYIDEYYKDLVLSDSQKESVAAELSQEKIIPEHMKKIALARLDLLKLWDRFRRERGVFGTANKDFLQLYNSGEFHTSIFQIIGKVSIGTLYRWKQSLGTRQKFNELYYYFRDFYLLYCAKDINIAFRAAKGKYLSRSKKAGLKKFILKNFSIILMN